ncbi:MAG: hypothetical protein DSZ35_05570 [Verrucomicrobia bacterium]|nr:MAG: hypothetical protein DSZ35_05570 [Verrucomicrobiota bacterium]
MPARRLAWQPTKWPRIPRKRGQFVPKSKKVLHATRMVAPLSATALRFTAPKEPGDYPYICTFPGHWIIMKGVMVVK